VAAILMGYDTESAAVGEGLARLPLERYPQYLPALDPESTVRGLEVIMRVHADLGVPATLFVCGRTLVHASEAVERAQATGLFDVQQHTYSHLLFRDVVYEAPPDGRITMRASPPVALGAELTATSDLISRLLGVEVVGLRTPFGFHQGLRGRADLLELLRQTGIRYVSSWIRNEQNGNPTPWIQPFAYEEEGYPDILEIPAQFWLDGIWFDAHGWSNGAAFQDALKGAVDEIVEHDLVYGVCFHEWAVLSADEEGTGWIRGFLSYAKELGVEITTYTKYWRRVAGSTAAQG
jgi:peptidoglycan/xylan/chitin deacetylase (PgdA/CDA1 family)